MSCLLLLGTIWIACFASHLVPVASGSQGQPSLISLFLLSRHGDRSPIHSLPKDPYENHWSSGLGQLTALGAEQHVNLGKFIRTRYPDFISPTYHKDEVFLHSSATERTLMSANCFARGLYAQQPTGIPPPVYSVPIPDDHLLKMSSNCPEFQRRCQAILNSTVSTNILMDNAEVIRILTKHFRGMLPPKPTSTDKVKAVWRLCDVLTVWANHKLPSPPEWLTKSVVDHCEKLLDQKHSICFSIPVLNRLRGGPLAVHILRLLHRRAFFSLPAEAGSYTHSLLPLETAVGYELENESLRKMRLIAYFAHDSTLSALTNYLGIFNGRKPPVASCLIVELHHLPHESDQLFVRFLLRNNTEPNSKHVHFLWPRGCGTLSTASKTNYLCSLHTLESSLRGTYAVDIQSSCQGIPLEVKRQITDPIDTKCAYPSFWVIALLQILFLLFLIRRIPIPFRSTLSLLLSFFR